MANSKIFCNIPWFEININHDGSYDLCGCQNDKIVGTELGKKYNIKNIPITEYWNNDRLKEARLRKLGDTPDPMCQMCQTKDQVGYMSNRVKENLKSVIFHQSFDRSFLQSPNYKHFKFSQENNGLTTSFPHSLHLNLGYHCNFACRMCNPFASTKIQTDYKQLNWIPRDQSFTHWSEDPVGWGNLLDFLDNHGNDIRVLHIIGGEPELLPKFQFIIQYFVDKGWAKNINISFTTNGSFDYSKYFDKLKLYKRCEIGISIESVDPIGDYIRQGGNIEEILKNILSMQQSSLENFQLAIRTVPSLLSLPTYANLITWAWQNKIPIDNSILVRPQWLQAALLPDTIKSKIINDVTLVKSQLPAPANDEFINQKHPDKIHISLHNECDSIINLAKQSAPNDADVHRNTCAKKLSQWDQLKNLNIKNYSVDLYNFLQEHGYHA